MMGSCAAKRRLHGELMGFFNRQSGVFLVLAAAMLWGTSGTAQRFAPGGYDPLVIGALRLLVGGAALLCLAVWRRELGHFRDWNWRQVLGAALCISSYQLCFFAGVHLTGVAVGTMVAIGCAPVLSGFFGHFLFGERLRPRWWLATSLAVTGCTLLGLGSAALHVNIWGILLALGAGLVYAAYNFFLKALLARHPPTAVVAVASGGGALLLLPVLWRCDPLWLLQWRSVAVVLHLGLATLALSYWLLARGLRGLPASTVVTLGLAEPVTATLLGLVVLGERLHSLSAAGIVLVFAGLLVLAAPLPRRVAGQGLIGGRKEA